MWKCPNCETINDKDICVICNTPKPVEKVFESVYSADKDNTVNFRDTVVTSAISSLDSDDLSDHITYKDPAQTVTNSAISQNVQSHNGNVQSNFSNNEQSNMTEENVINNTAIYSESDTAPYNQNVEATPVTEDAKPKKKKHKGLIVAICLIVTAILLITGCVVYLEYNYRHAKDVLEQDEYDSAKDLFNSISFYRNSDKMVYECDYQRAKDLLDDGKWDEAKEVFKTIAEYSDSEGMIKECDYRKAIYHMECGENTEALNIFVGIRDYSDSSRKIEEILHVDKNEEYYKAKNYYKDGNFILAQKHFGRADDYMDSADYRVLIDAINGDAPYYKLEALLNSETDHVSSEAGRIIMMHNDYAVKFLEGNWHERYGDGYLVCSYGGYIYGSFPGDYYADYYHIANGIYYEGNRYCGNQILEINIIDTDTISVEILSDGSVNTYYRD